MRQRDIDEQGLTDAQVDALDGGDAPPVIESAPERQERRSAARRLLRAEVFYLSGLVAFAGLAALAHLYAYFGWDLRAARALQSFDAPAVRGLMRLASVCGDGWIPHALTGLTAAVFLTFRRRSEAAGLVFSAAGSAIVNSLLKALIARPRPTSDLVEILVNARHLSFPSGHVTFSVSYFGFLFFVAYALLPRGTLARRLTLTASALPLPLVGLSRVYLGAHWPSDTMGAYLASGLWLALSLHLYRRWKQRATFKRLAAGTPGAAADEKAKGATSTAPGENG